MFEFHRTNQGGNDYVEFSFDALIVAHDHDSRIRLEATIRDLQDHRKSPSKCAQAFARFFNPLANYSDFSYKQCCNAPAHALTRSTDWHPTEIFCSHAKVYLTITNHVTGQLMKFFASSNSLISPNNPHFILTLRRIDPANHTLSLSFQDDFLNVQHSSNLNPTYEYQLAPVTGPNGPAWLLRSTNFII